MRIYEKDPRCWLAELSDLTADPIPDRVREHLPTIRLILDWAQGYLAQPHPELGRPGPVCPFVRPAMARGTMFYSVWPGADLDADEVESVARSFRDWFLELEPVSGRDAQYKSINIIFPDLPMSEVGRLIDGTQERLKPLYTREGIMIGEFHPGPPQKAGLWNEEFRPLRCPLPLLSIRHLVPTDFAFLNDRKEFMEAYLAAHAGKVPSAMARAVREAALRFGLLADEEESPADAERAEEAVVAAAVEEAVAAAVAERRAGELQPIVAVDTRAGESGAAASVERRAGELQPIVAVETRAGDFQPVIAVDVRAGESRAAAAAGCPHHAAEEARAAAAAGCPHHAEAARPAALPARQSADPGAEPGERVPAGRIANHDDTGAGVREPAASPPPIHTEETNR